MASYSDKTIESAVTLGKQLGRCSWKVFLDGAKVGTYKVKFPAAQETLSEFFVRAQSHHDQLKRFMEVVHVPTANPSFVFAVRPVSDESIGATFPKETPISNRVPIYEAHFYTGVRSDRINCFEQTGLIPWDTMQSQNLRLVDEQLTQRELDKSIKRWHLPTSCSACGKELSREDGKYCACRAVKYCNRQCQKQDWPSHKATCGGKGDAAPAGEPVAAHIRIGEDGEVTSLTFATASEAIAMGPDEEVSASSSSSAGPMIRNSPQGAALAHSFIEFCKNNDLTEDEF